MATNSHTSPTVETAQNHPISGPYYEPEDQGGLAYWKCDDCAREAMRPDDIHSVLPCDTGR